MSDTAKGSAGKGNATLLKKGVTVALLCSIVVFSVFAGGKHETESKSAGTDTSWKESFDIENKKPGTYNIVVTAEDIAGNTAVAGPFNIVIDPDSDLPVTGITNPTPEMRVPGNLNIVGTCIDDDGVEYVELIIDGDKENPVVADGKEFWSCYVDTTKLEEGAHTISVSGVDINGKRGKPTTVRWHLDRSLPVTEVGNIGLGALVSRKITLQGKVLDGNGVKELAYSIDGGKTFEPVSMKIDKKTAQGSFSVSIDTRTMPDGPQVCWFRARDSQGSQGISSFLYFADNTNPDLTLLYPGDGESVNGIFSVAGRTWDKNRVKRLTYTLGKETGELPLTPGNPYWTKEFDIRTDTAKSLELVVSAEDTAGNVTVLRKKIAVDREADKPVVELAFPVLNDAPKAPPVLVGNELYIRGRIHDDDGVASLSWKLDDGELHTVGTSGVFFVDVFAALPALPAFGTHKVTLFATDIHGINGNQVVVPFSMMGAAPVFGGATVSVKLPRPAETEYIPGMEVHPEGTETLNGSVSGEVGLERIAWTVNGAAAGEKQLGGKKKTDSFAIPLKDAPWGLVEIEVSATDVHGRETKSRYTLYRTDVSQVRGGARQAGTAATSATRGLPEVVFSDSGIEEDGRIPLAAGGTVSGYFVGGTAQSVELDPQTPFVSAALSGNSIILTAGDQAGTSERFAVKVTSERGLVYESRRMYLEIAEREPLLELDGGALTGRRTGGATALAGDPAFEPAPNAFAPDADTAPAVCDGFEDVTLSGCVALPPVHAKDSTLTVRYHLLSTPGDAVRPVPGLTVSPSVYAAKVKAIAAAKAAAEAAANAVVVADAGEMVENNADVTEDDFIGDDFAAGELPDSEEALAADADNGPGLERAEDAAFPTETALAEEPALAQEPLLEEEPEVPALPDTTDIPVPGAEWRTLTLSEDGTFTETIPAGIFPEGITIVEVQVQSSAGPVTTDALFVAKVSPLPLPDPENPKAKKAVAKPPVVAWVEGEHLYYTAYYQGDLDFVSCAVKGTPCETAVYGAQAGVVARETFAPGTTTTLEVKVAVSGTKTTKGAKFSETTGAVPAIKIADVNGVPYMSGMTHILAPVADKKNPEKIRILVESALPVKEAQYTLTGTDNFTLGAPATLRESGKVPLKRVAAGDTGNTDASATPQYEGFITLKGYPAEKTTITVSAAIGKETPVSASGTVFFVRPTPETGAVSDERIYWLGTGAAAVNDALVLDRSEKITAYVNVPGPYMAEARQNGERAPHTLVVSQSGAYVTLEPAADGLFKDVTLFVTDVRGVTHESEPVTLRADFAEPALAIVAPVEQSWQHDVLELSAAASDENGIESVQYSLDGGETWQALELAVNAAAHGTAPYADNASAAQGTGAGGAVGAVYRGNIDISQYPDGLVGVDVAALDTAGKRTVRRASLFKDTTPPTVRTITPEAGSEVNGETRVVMLVTDNGRLVGGAYNFDGNEAGAPEAAPAPQDFRNAPEAAPAVPADAASPTRAIPAAPAITQALEPSSAVTLMVGTKDMPIDNAMYFTFTDAAGNVAVVREKDFAINAENDKPVVEVHLPLDNAVQTTDFVVSGVIYDDDGDARIWYKIDDGEFQPLDSWGSSWVIPIGLHTLTDNEHTITVYAEDQMGVLGDPVSRRVRVSLEEPQGAVTSPSFTDTVSNRIQITGTAFDRNGIKRVQVSVDNGNSWQDASGLENWTFEFDTNVVPDGTHVVFLHIWDDYDVESLYSSIINIDNSSPAINLVHPMDDAVVTQGAVLISGQATDNVSLEKLYVRIHSLDKRREVPADLCEKRLEIADIINEVLDIGALEDGPYNMEISGEDAAGNVTRVSRNITVDTGGSPVTLSTMYPFNGERISGMFNLYGSVKAEEPVRFVSLLLDGQEVAAAQVSSAGYYKFELGPEQVSAGDHVYSVRTVLRNGKLIYSPEQFFYYVPAGP